MIDELLAEATRFLFFTGKGGVGKTTLASAVSVALADAGHRVLLISTDPASNLDEVLETSLGSEARPVSSAPNLWAMNIDPEAAAADYRERIVGPYRGVLPDSAVAQIEEQLSGACTTEIASFNEFTRFLGESSASEGYDHVVLDTAPTGHTLRLLDLPAAWNDFIASNQTGSSCLGPMSGLVAQKAVYARAVATLTDATATTLILVARADRNSLAEADRAGRELRSSGIAHQQLVVNAVFHAANPDDLVAAALQAEAEEALAEMPESLASLPSERIKFQPTEAVGLQRLRTLTKPTDTIAPPRVDPDPVPAFRSLDEFVADISQRGSGVVMTMGKGGVGKTTVAIDVAQRLARQGHEVLLATTDPADHITGRVADLPANLEIRAIDPKRETHRHVQQVLKTTGKNLDADARALLEEELRSPCIEEIAVFTAFAKLVATGSSKYVVLDTAPTGHTLLLLDTTEAYHREVERNVANLDPEVRDLLPRLRDPDHTKVLLVTLPEATPVHEAMALRKDLQRAGIQPHGWIINRSLHGSETRDPVLKAKQAQEKTYLREVAEQAECPVALIPLRVRSILANAG